MLLTQIIIAQLLLIKSLDWLIYSDSIAKNKKVAICIHLLSNVLTCYQLLMQSLSWCLDQLLRECWLLDLIEMLILVASTSAGNTDYPLLTWLVALLGGISKVFFFSKIPSLLCFGGRIKSWLPNQSHAQSENKWWVFLITLLVGRNNCKKV